MQKSIDRLRKLLLEFIEQRDDLMLVIACPPGEAALMLNLLLAQERDRRADLFYLFAEDFPASQSYVESVVQRLRRDYDASVESADQGIEPFPPLTPTCLATAEA